MSEFNLDEASDDLLAFCWQNLPPRERARVMGKAPRTVWWFGAGASHHYNFNINRVPLPLANSFFEAFNTLPTFQSFQAHVGPFISYLREYKMVQTSDVQNWRENIEDFMTSVEAQITALKEALVAKGDLTEDERSDAFSLAPLFNNLGFILASVVNEWAVSMTKCKK